MKKNATKSNRYISKSSWKKSIRKSLSVGLLVSLVVVGVGVIVGSYLVQQGTRLFSGASSGPGTAPQVANYTRVIEAESGILTAPMTKYTYIASTTNSQL